MYVCIHIRKPKSTENREWLKSRSLIVKWIIMNPNSWKSSGLDANTAKKYVRKHIQEQVFGLTNINKNTDSKLGRLKPEAKWLLYPPGFAHQL